MIVIGHRGASSYRPEQAMRAGCLRRRSAKHADRACDFLWHPRARRC
jgi:hypothetical protein